MLVSMDWTRKRNPLCRVESAKRSGFELPQSPKSPEGPIEKGDEASIRCRIAPKSGENAENSTMASVESHLASQGAAEQRFELGSGDAVGHTVEVEATPISWTLNEDQDGARTVTDALPDTQWASAIAWATSEVVRGKIG